MAKPKKELNPDDPSFDDDIDKLAGRKTPLTVNEVHSLPGDGAAKYVLRKAEIEQGLGNIAPALIPFGLIIKNENDRYGVDPEQIKDVISIRYADEDGDFEPDKVIEEYEDAMTDSDEED